MDADYFKKRLHDAGHSDSKLLEARSQSAFATYTELYDKGIDPRVALEYAIGELFNGL